MVKNILVDNRKTRILSDIEFVMKNQELKELLFCVVFRKIKWQHFQEMQISYFWTLFVQIWAKMNFHKNWAPSLLFPEHSPRKNHTQTCDILYFRKKKQTNTIKHFPCVDRRCRTQSFFGHTGRYSYCVLEWNWRYLTMIGGSASKIFRS